MTCPFAKDRFCSRPFVSSIYNYMYHFNHSNRPNDPFIVRNDLELWLPKNSVYTQKTLEIFYHAWPYRDAREFQATKILCYCWYVHIVDDIDPLFIIRQTKPILTVLCNMKRSARVSFICARCMHAHNGIELLIGQLLVVFHMENFIVRLSNCSRFQIITNKYFDVLTSRIVCIQAFIQHMI